MKTVQSRAVSAVVIALFLAYASSASADDWEAARKASCQELGQAYATTLANERKVVAAIKDSKDGTVATNILGIATLATVGFGFFTWDDNHSAQENLADLRNDLAIIRTVAGEKKCTLPVL